MHKLFHNPILQDKHLRNLLPGVFFNIKRRLIVYIMQRLKDAVTDVTRDNILMWFTKKDDHLLVFLKKNNINELTDEDLELYLYDPSVDTSDRMADFAFDELYKVAFTRFVEDRLGEVKYINSYGRKSGQTMILSNAKAIIKMHDILYNHSIGKRDQLQEAMDMVNSNDEYIQTCLSSLNSYIGGFSRGYVGSIIAKSSHCKSTFADYNSVHTLVKQRANEITIITPEESAATRWRRIIAMITKTSTTQMRQKNVKITNEHIETVKKALGNRLKIIDSAHKYKDVVDAMEASKSDMIVVDHVNAIDYPGVGDFMSRMIGGIPGLINTQKVIAKQKHMAIINLSQVNDKDIQRSDRLSKAPRYWDAYGSSVLYQAAREYLALWYPYKEFDDNPMMFGNRPPSPNDVQIAIEKSSFSAINKFNVIYEPDFATFRDNPNVMTKVNSNSNYIAPSEKATYEQQNLFK